MRFLAGALPALCVLCLRVSAAVAIQDVTVVDIASGAPRLHQTVLIQRDRIVAIGATASTPIPDGSTIVSGKGRFLIPGLWDMHVHLWYEQNQLPLYLAFGVTGVQDMGSTLERVRQWRATIDTGKAPGPHIVTCGPPIADKPTGDPKLPGIVARNPEEARKAFDQLWDLDVDFIKILSGVPRDAYFALAEQSRHWGVRFAGHVPSSITAIEAVDARQRSLEHLFGVQKVVMTNDVLDEKKTVEFFERSAAQQVRHTPTLVLWRRMAHLDDERLKSDSRLNFVPDAIRKQWPDPAAESKSWTDKQRAEWKEQVARIYRIVTLAKRTKVELLAGTDTGDPYTIPGATLHDELEELVAAGLTPREALESATIAPARYLGWDESMGSIQKGKVADLVLLDADPIADIRNTRKIAGVVARGKYFSRKELDGFMTQPLQ
jgi:imidazolonepropionase-like amidohydrolase